MIILYNRIVSTWILPWVSILRAISAVHSPIVLVLSFPGGVKSRVFNQSHVFGAFTRLGNCIDYTYTGRTVW